jgi:uncharacterized protein (DUF4415 family)
MSAEQEARLCAMRDEDIDFSDIPNQAGKVGWRPGLLSAVALAEVRREALRQKMLLLDDDVAAFFQEQGQSAAERMNAVLREYAERQRKRA